MKKIKLGVIFGGMSTEHDVSVVSGTSVIKNLDKEKYEIDTIYIDPKGIWHRYIKPISEIDILKIGERPTELNIIENEIEYIRKFDIVFPVLHGLYGEDGTIQGLLELLKIPYVGCKVLSSSIAMDKAYAKVIFQRAQIPQAKYIYIRSYKEKYIYIDEHYNETIETIEDISKRIREQLKFPLFIKPSNSGSSVGIKKAYNEEQLKEGIAFASKFDNKILIEENINGREVECSVLGNEEVKASCIGEILPAEEFYSFDAKYKNAESKVIIPADVPEEKQEEVKKYAIKAFKAINGSGFARVDFFIERDTDKVYINEINTIPGFTEISMYPKLWNQEGISYTKLLDKLIELAQK